MSTYTADLYEQSEGLVSPQSAPYIRHADMDPADELDAVAELTTGLPPWLDDEECESAIAEVAYMPGSPLVVYADGVLTIETWDGPLRRFALVARVDPDEHDTADHARSRALHVLRAIANGDDIDDNGETV